MKKTLQLMVIFLVMVFDAEAQPIYNPVGASAWMAGSATTAVADVWSATNNVGAIPIINKWQAGLYAEQRFNERKLNFSSLNAVLPLKYLHMAFGVNYFGYSAFNQQRSGIALAKRLHKQLAMGIKVSYVSTTIADYGSSGNVVLEYGLWLNPFKNVDVGLALFNPTQSRYSGMLDEKIPTYNRLGIKYRLDKNIDLLLDAEQRLGSPLSVRAGVKYMLKPVLSLALGAASNPFIYTAGASVSAKYIRFDFAASFHQFLGFSPHIGLSFPLNHMQKEHDEQ